MNLLNFIVYIDESPAKLLGDQPSSRRFSGTHKTCESDLLDSFVHNRPPDGFSLRLVPQVSFSSVMGSRMKEAISGVCGRWNPSIKRGDRNSEVARYILRRNTGGEQLLCRLDLALSHLPFPPSHSPKLPGDFQPGAGPFNCQFPFHLS